MTNQDYVTINVNGIFLGDKLTTSYRGKEFESNVVKDAMTGFEILRNVFKYDIEELHCLASETPGTHDTVGNPSEKTGQYIWGRAKLSNNNVSPWVYVVDGVGYGVKFIPNVIVNELLVGHRHKLRVAMLGWDARALR